MLSPDLPRSLSMLLLAMVLAVAPVLPAYAYVAPTDDASAQLHAGHGLHAMPTLVDPSADTAQDACGQHDSCHGQCCASCAQCLSATILIAPVYAKARAVKSPSVQQWRPQMPLSAPHRPPPAA